MTAALAVQMPKPSRRRIIAGFTAALQGLLSGGLAGLSLLVPGATWAAPIFLLFFGVAAAGAAVHAYPPLIERWTLLAVRPGTFGAVLFFVLASLHWMVALGAVIGIFFSSELWRSVPLFLGSVMALGAISVLFAASGYFLWTLERLSTSQGGD